MRFAPLLLLLAGCGAGTSNFDAPRPDPHFSAHWRAQDGDAGSVEVSGITDAAECSVKPELETICVRGLQSALQDGLEAVVTGFMPVSPGAGTGAFLAHLVVQDFTHDRAAAAQPDPSRPETSSLAERPDLQVQLVWTFELLDRQGHSLVHLERTTVGPRTITDLQAEGATAIRALEDDVLEQIAEAVDAARVVPPTSGDEAPLEPSGPDAPPPPAAPAAEPPAAP